MIDRSLSIIRQELDVEKASHKNFKDFHMYKSLGATLTASFRDADKVAWVSLAKYASSYPIGKYANRGVDQYLFGHITLPSRYPRTYIYKETLQEVIADLFLKREVDFDHSKSFSRKFHVLTEDKQRLETLMQSKNLDTLAEYPDMELEFNNTSLLFRNSRKSVSVEEATLFCHLTKALLSIFG